MKHFSIEEIKPSEQTLHIIRQIAHTYRVAKPNGQNNKVYCLN